MYDSIDEIYEDLVILMDKDKTIIKEEESKVNIKVPLESHKFKEIVFTLNKLTKNEEEKYKELLLSITNLNNEIKDLKTNYLEQIKTLSDENKSLKEEINYLKNKMSYLETYFEIIKQKEEKNKIYIKNLDSLIINKNEEYNKTLKKWIYPERKIKAKLLFRASRDGDSYDIFHKLCDYQKPTLELVKFKKGNILGSYTTLDWETKSNWKSDLNLFVFSLTENKKANKKKSQYNRGIECYSDKGPETYLLAFDRGQNMRKIRVRLDDQEYDINTQLLAPDMQTEKYYDAEEVEIFKIIIDK